MTVLETKYISKSAANQRKGRSGRTQAGIAYRLYSKGDFDLFEDDNKPEISLMNLETVILKIK
jgi:HrpA-like RNA helicase